MTRVHFILDDAEVLAWLERQPNKSATIRQAIRQAMQGTSVDDLAAQLAEVTAGLEAVRASVEDLAVRGATVGGNGNGKVGSVEGSLPAEVLANLSELGNW